MYATSFVHRKFPLTRHRRTGHIQLLNLYNSHFLLSLYLYKQVGLLSCSFSAGMLLICPTVVQKIVSQPPTQEFLAGIKLQMESIPVSEIPISEIPVPEIPSPDITKIHGQYQQQQAAVHGPIPPLGHPSGQRPPSPYGSPPDRGMQYPSTWASPGGQPTLVPHPQPGMWATPVSVQIKSTNLFFCLFVIKS